MGKCVLPGKDRCVTDPPGTPKMPFSFLTMSSKLMKRSIYRLEQTVPQQRGFGQNLSHLLCCPKHQKNPPETSCGTCTQIKLGSSFSSTQIWYQWWMAMSTAQPLLNCTLITHPASEGSDFPLNMHSYVHVHPPFTKTSAGFPLFFQSFTKRFNTYIR